MLKTEPSNGALTTRGISRGASRGTSRNVRNTVQSTTILHRPPTAAFLKPKMPAQLAERPFTSSGRPPLKKYEHCDSGLVPVVKHNEKLKHFRERYDKIQEARQIEEKSKGFRWFDEYDISGLMEMYITIEFCTNCYMHKESTRHNEEKYVVFANTLRREIIRVFPAINVILKPLIFDHNDESPECWYLRQRLGAFEVQLFIKNSKGETFKYTLFSKLHSTLWPSIAKILQKIPEFIPSEINPNIPSSLIYNSLPDYVIPDRTPLKQVPTIQIIGQVSVPRKYRPVTAAAKPVSRRKLPNKEKLPPLLKEKVEPTPAPVVEVKEPEPPKEEEIEFSIHNIDSEEPVIDACVILRESKDIEMEKWTDVEGKCVVPLEKLKRTRLIINHKKYFGMVEEYGGPDGIDILKVSKDNKKKIYLIPRPADENEVQMRFLPGNGVKCVDFVVLNNEIVDNATDNVIVQSNLSGKELITMKNLLKKQTSVFRIIGKVLRKNLEEFLHQESTFMISYYEDCKPITITHPPVELMDDKDENTVLLWDVGFFADPAANKQFVEINGWSKKDLNYNSYLEEYQTLCTSLYGNLNGDLKKLLGFNEDTEIERDNDVFISKRNVYASINKFGLKGKNIDHLLLSARSKDGVYSYKECERKFGSLQGPFNFIPYRKLKSLMSIDNDAAVVGASALTKK